MSGIEGVREVDQQFLLDPGHSLAVIEDSAEALGSAYFGEKCGTLGEMGILSFNGNKIITTSGGGALIAHKKEHKDKAIFLARIYLSQKKVNLIFFCHT